MTFIAVENMASAYGDKSLNTANKPGSSGSPGSPGSTEKRPKDMTQREFKKQQQRQRQQMPRDTKYADKQRVYTARKELANDLGYELQDGAAGNIFDQVSEFAKGNKSHCRYGIAGSLPSMLKRLAFESGKCNIQFDTLVFVGHGNMGVMTVGMGSGPDLLREEYYDKLDENQQVIVNEMKLKTRHITVRNKDTWLALFDEVKHCFTGDENGIFHVMFVGCCTANMSESSCRYLTHKVAKHLAPLLGLTVNAYGMRAPIDNRHVMETLQDIVKIKRTAPRNPGDAEGTFLLKSRIKGDHGGNAQVVVASWKH